GRDRSSARGAGVGVRVKVAPAVAPRRISKVLRIIREPFRFAAPAMGLDQGVVRPYGTRCRVEPVARRAANCAPPLITATGLPVSTDSLDRLKFGPSPRAIHATRRLHRGSIVARKSGTAEPIRRWVRDNARSERVMLTL